MKKLEFKGYVKSISANADSDVLTLAYGSYWAGRIDVEIKHEDGNERLFRRPLTIEVTIKEREEQ